MNKHIITTAILLLSSTSLAQAQCIARPSCTELGFTKSASDCTNAVFVMKCPFDTTKINCIGCDFGDYSLSTCPANGNCISISCDEVTKYKLTSCRSGYHLSTDKKSCKVDTPTGAIKIKYGLHGSCDFLFTFNVIGDGGIINFYNQGNTYVDPSKTSYTFRISKNSVNSSSMYINITFTGNITHIQLQEAVPSNCTYSSSSIEIEEFLQMDLSSITSLKGNVSKGWSFAGDCTRLYYYNMNVLIPPNVQNLDYAFYKCWSQRSLVTYILTPPPMTLVSAVGAFWRSYYNNTNDDYKYKFICPLSWQDFNACENYCDYNCRADMYEDEALAYIESMERSGYTCDYNTCVSCEDNETYARVSCQR